MLEQNITQLKPNYGSIMSKHTHTEKLPPHSHRPDIPRTDQLEHDPVLDLSVPDSSLYQETDLGDLGGPNHGSLPNPNLMTNLLAHCYTLGSLVAKR
jgi:hypothetical protein